ncbi:hypothetical protein HRR83_007945 [Exophiala dermatitidis]|uniref:Short chain dehydrogenase/reductase n=2 Tax=Exophiala dermatitidis TaxID=5970 RepID=H6BUI5_EXODN|nr:short chain dehydrogenase/reductase [Exophiala dermatitidis NIH/UT8656]KAJ4506543.1 hypothetical protein HRR75_006784 [Exophiala dermatitidis]EHY55727.1 short chain dehydrogenase/reductase [Exophiala dermatitidis NIH/UT8656]KAJ4508810.1 hypothetical protein HRR74_007401 [Exophiala dermatitidis]KAJ4510062.1 hypothetical protein HRR73_006859 [Exophiala dermatitidis]KAJ4539064.1 hypothetical protein HRR77_006480 [Exophiala dermatitidis]
MASRVVLITGANSGVGYGVTQVLASASEKFHVIMASRSLERATKAKAEIEASGIEGRLSTVQMDVTDPDSVGKAADRVGQEFGKVDVLVNNAGVASIDQDVLTRFRTCLTTNVIGTALVTAAFRPLLLKSSKPTSIYVSSGSGSLTRTANLMTSKLPIPGSTDAYQASKAALNMIALQERADYHEQGLKVFIVCPGFVRSNLRGTSPDLVSGWGLAKDPRTAGETMLSIIRGQRDADEGKFIHEDGIYPW